MAYKRFISCEDRPNLLSIRLASSHLRTRFSDLPNSWTKWLLPLTPGPAILLLIGGWLVLCAPWFFNQRTIPYDSKAQFYPIAYFVSQSLRNGELPFWNPHIYGGYPTISDPQAMLFSPLALLLMLVVENPSFHWFDSVELIHTLMGGLGMLLLCIRFGYTPVAGLFSAAVYMFGGSAGGRLQHVPMILAYNYFPIALFSL